MLREETETAWCPDWYATVQAAKYFNVAPWDLLQQSVFWRDKALIAITAENQAQDILDRRKGK